MSLFDFLYTPNRLFKQEICFNWNQHVCQSINISRLEVLDWQCLSVARTTNDQCWPLITSMTQSQHWSDQNVTSVWSLHVEHMVEHMCTEGLLLLFLSFMINWAVFTHCTTYPLHRQREHFHESLYNSILLYFNYQMIKREHITQVNNPRNGSPNKQNSVIKHN